ncbi:MAG: hypothetical protein ACK41O_25695, partial [Runella zeae]
MKKYEEYTALDFVKDDSFRDWVRGKGRDESFWMHFLQQHPEKKTDIRQAELLIRAMNVAPESLSEKEVRQEVTQFLEKITQPANSHVSSPARVWWQHPFYRLAAMVTFVVLSLGTWWAIDRSEKTELSSLSLPLEHLLAETVNETEGSLMLT